MDKFPHDANCLKDPSASVRKLALQRVTAVWEGLDEETRVPYSKEAVKHILRLFEDKRDALREGAAQLAKEMLRVPHNDAAEQAERTVAVLVARLAGTNGEEAEHVRLELMDIVCVTLETFPHDVVRRGWLDHYAAILEACLRHADPEMKVASCKAIRLLCQAARNNTKPVALQIAQALKPNLRVKQFKVRRESVVAFGCLLSNGALELVYDFQKEVNEIHTTRSLMKALVVDRAEAVRRAALDVISDLTMEVSERQDMHRHYVPLVLLALTDEIEAVRLKAVEILRGLGAFYEMDNEDNRIGLEDRRITLKDIQWYGDDMYPDMTMHVKSKLPGTDFTQRPPLGVRLAVAECCRTVVPMLLSDIVALEWNIPNSTINRRKAAIRTLVCKSDAPSPPHTPRTQVMLLWFIESNALQYMQGILDALYKVLRDDDAEIKHEAFVCLELMGKLHDPSNYLPLVLTTSGEGAASGGSLVVAEKENLDNVERREVRRRTLTVFSTTANTTKVNILIAFKYLLLGATKMDREQAAVITRAVTSPDVVDVEAPPQLHALLDLLSVLKDIFLKYGVIAPYAEGAVSAPESLDFQFFFTLLDVQSCVDVTVQAKACSELAALSVALTGSEDALYATHFVRAISDKGNIPLSVFSKLLQHGGAMLGRHTADVVDIFLVHLHNVRYDVDVRDKLNCMNLLNEFVLKVKANSVTLTPSQIEQLLLSVVIPHGRWHVGGAAHLFRKVSLSILSAFLVQGIIPTTLWVPEVEDPQSEDGRRQLEEGRSLLTSTVDTWRNALDADDTELRLVVAKTARHIMRLPLEEVDATENTKELLLRMDDSSDVVRGTTAAGFQQLFADLAAGRLCPGVVKMFTGERVGVWVGTLLLHMDDANEELKETVCQALEEVKKAYPDTVVAQALHVRSKHMTTRLIDRLTG